MTSADSPTSTSTLTSTATSTFTATPMVVVSVQGSVNAAAPGTTVTYSVLLNVTGNNAQNVLVSANLGTTWDFVVFGSVPAGGTYYYNYATNSLSWSWPNLPIGTYSFTFQVQVPSLAACGSTPMMAVQASAQGAAPQGNSTQLTVQCGTATPVPTMTLTPGTAPISTPITYPNPTDGGPILVRINFGHGADHVKYEIFTTAFRKVREYRLSNIQPGVLETSLEMKDDWGTPLASGLYYLVVTNGSDRSVGKILVIR